MKNVVVLEGAVIAVPSTVEVTIKMKADHQARHITEVGVLNDQLLSDVRFMRDCPCDLRNAWTVLQDLEC